MSNGQAVSQEPWAITAGLGSASAGVATTRWTEFVRYVARAALSRASVAASVPLSRRRDSGTRGPGRS